MMNFLGNLVWLTLALTLIIIFLCVGLMGLAVLDYMLDSDIKGALVDALGPRPLLKRLRKHLEDLVEKLDKPTEKEIIYQTDLDSYEKVKKDDEPHTSQEKDYNATVHKTIKDILEESGYVD